jgi:hypothetical protein
LLRCVASSFRGSKEKGIFKKNKKTHCEMLVRD